MKTALLLKFLKDDNKILLISIIVYYFLNAKYFLRNRLQRLCVVVHTCSPSTQETEAGGLGQSELHSETLLQKQTQKQGLGK
jgi:hypothetical protein